jgi:hypothetical protein
MTPAQYEAGASIKSARGHASTPERNIWRKKAIDAGVRQSVAGFDKLKPADAERLGKQWILGFMSKSKGPLEPVKITDWRYGRRDAPDKVRYQTDEQKNARIEFLQFLDENPDLEEMDEKDWKAYRDNYMASFTKQ